MTKKFSFRKIKAFASVCLFVFCAAQISFAQENLQKSSSENQSQQPFQYSAVQNQENPSAEKNPAPYWSNSSSENQVKSPSSFALFLRMVISLLIVIGLVYFVVRIFKKSSGFSDSDDLFLRRTAQISLGAGKSVQIITLLENAYLIGVTDNGINLISEIKDKELVNSLNLLADKNQNAARPKNFSDILDIFLARGKNKNAFSDSAKRASDILKNQRERFNRGE